MTPPTAAAWSPETAAAVASSKPHIREEISPEITSAQPAGAASLGTRRNRPKVNAVPAPGPIKGSETEIAFPAKVVANMEALPMRTPAARRMICWARAKAIKETNSDEQATRSHVQSARGADVTDRPIVSRSNQANPISPPMMRTSATIRARGRRPSDFLDERRSTRPPTAGSRCRASAEITAPPSTVIPDSRCQQQRALPRRRRARARSLRGGARAVAPRCRGPGRTWRTRPGGTRPWTR